MIPAAGVGGKPFSGQEESAEMKASCNASSAQSKEPERRMSVAMILPDSSRKTCSMVSPGSGTEKRIAATTAAAQRKNLSGGVDLAGAERRGSEGEGKRRRW